MSFLLYKHTTYSVFVSEDFRPLSEDLPKLSRRPDKRSRTFSKKFRKFPKISEDCRRLSRKTWRCFDDAPTNLRETWYQWNHRYLHICGCRIALSICYQSVYHWLLHNKYFSLCMNEYNTKSCSLFSARCLCGGYHLWSNPMFKSTCS